MILRGMIWRFLAESGMIVKSITKTKTRKSKTRKAKTKKRRPKGIIKISKW